MTCSGGESDVAWSKLPSSGDDGLLKRTGSYTAGLEEGSHVGCLKSVGESFPKGTNKSAGGVGQVTRDGLQEPAGATSSKDEFKSTEPGGQEGGSVDGVGCVDKHMCLSGVRIEGENESQGQLRVMSPSAVPGEVEYMLEHLEGDLGTVQQVTGAEVKKYLPRWTEAMRKEIKTIEPGIVRLSRREMEKIMAEYPDTELLPGKIVATIKPVSNATNTVVDSGGSTPQSVRYKRKIRIVVCGNYSTTGLSEEDVYAAGAAADTLRSVLAAAGLHQYELGSTDVSGAFLNTPMGGGRKVIVRAPALLSAAGLTNGEEFWLLERCLYGLKQAPKKWADHRDQLLGGLTWAHEEHQYRLVQCMSDGNLWRVQRKLTKDGYQNGPWQEAGFFLVYVDDILLAMKQGEMQSAYDAILRTWEVSPLEIATETSPVRYLGMDIRKESDGVNFWFSISQEAYIEDIVKSHGLQEEKLPLLPITREQALYECEDKVPGEGVNLKMAQRFVGELLWISQRSRPDITYLTSLMASRIVRDPGHVEEVGKRALLWLYRTKAFRLHLRPEGDNVVSSYSDASFAPTGRHSITGLVVTWRRVPLTWRSVKQSMVSLSTAEAELQSIVEGVVFMDAVYCLVAELSGEGEVPKKVIRGDNSASLSIIQEQGGPLRTRHLRLRGAHLRERLSTDLELIHTPGSIQWADLLTKAFARPRLVELQGLWGSECSQDPTQTSQSSAQNPSPGSNAHQVQSVKILLQTLMLLMQIQEGQSQPEEHMRDPDGIVQVSFWGSVVFWGMVGMLVLCVLVVWEFGKWCFRQASQSRRERLLRLRAEASQTQERFERAERIKRLAAREVQEAMQQTVSSSRLEPAGLTIRTEVQASGLSASASSGSSSGPVVSSGRRTCTVGVQTEAFSQQRRRDLPSEIFMATHGDKYHTRPDCFGLRNTRHGLHRREVCLVCQTRASREG